jgi:hypothetical protein
MHPQRLLLAAAAATLAATSAQAQVTTPTVSASLGYTKKEESELEAVQARLTGRFHRNFGAEVEGAIGIEPYSLELPSVPPIYFKNQLRHELGAYALGYLPVRPNAELFARVGYANSWHKRTFVNGAVTAVRKVDVGSWNYESARSISSTARTAFGWTTPARITAAACAAMIPGRWPIRGASER